MGITLRQLEYLDAVANAGSVTKAAQALFVSQSAVSTSIGELESELNVKLFVRHSRGLALSREGIEILRHSRALLQSANELKSIASHLTDSLTGTLNIGVYATLAPRLIPAIVEQFRREHPDLKLVFTEGSRMELLSGLEQGAFSAVIIYDYDFELNLSDFGEVTKLSSAPPYVLLPNNHRLAGKGPVRLEELADDPFVLFELEPAAQYFMSIFSSRGLEPRIEYRTGSFEIIRSMVARGMGYSLMTQRTISRRSYEDIAFYPSELDGEFAELDVVAVTPRGVGRTAKINVLLDAATRIYENVPRYS